MDEWKYNIYKKKKKILRHFFRFDININHFFYVGYDTLLYVSPNSSKFLQKQNKILFHSNFLKIKLKCIIIKIDLSN